ncbi:unnamed protein product [Vitrella brassicaformis CCMP3155]|uniref:6-phosphogluconate dehydrogenase NADP-binding domain-containing protein n=2 Tax=Vitrella brassicaformis TaxID=1169539 RepID=A0A0G4EIL3_VITBC|nr:unnamed protein product [Vitrella brassicaformis CCMP3155]|mmetsp:Transcript_8505/g.20960  ORF Transcript_8505/g.20960 Transcript_8505/m.20960 type:complete len:406 (+) Transcript_8505:114-1331(+)|eukprot:CEL95727.1 unnamed protein product [Vitrella brassicaformis CCMP3155]
MGKEVVKEAHCLSIDCSLDDCIDEQSTWRPTIGFIGCGTIGGRHVENFLENGYAVCVYDISATRMAETKAIGAKLTAGCYECAASSDVIFTSLPTPADVSKAVLDEDTGILRAIAPGKIYVDITTNSTAMVHRLCGAIEARGGEMLDAPFNDCPVGATSIYGMGLAVLASGNIDTFHRVHHLLALMADNVLYCGSIGKGTECKLIHNAVNAVAVQAVSEGVTLGLAAGIPLNTIWDALRLGAFGQNAGDIHGLPHYWFSRRMDSDACPPAFTVKLLRKDLRLTLALAKERDVPVPQISATEQEYMEAEKRGWAHCAATKVRCLQEARAGVVAKGDVPLLPHPMMQCGSAPSSPRSAPSASRTANRKSAACISRECPLWMVVVLVVVTNLVQWVLRGAVQGDGWWL